MSTAESPDMKLRVLIADDEPLSRERLRQFLREDPRAEVVAECASGTEVVGAIREKSPDLVFLDVRMPELDGFGVIAALKGTPLPAIIFVTGYDQFALRAFEVRAVDYLLKPFDRERFQGALQRALEWMRLASDTQRSLRLAGVLETMAARPKSVARLTIKSGGRISFVNPDEIDWIRAADNYTELHVGQAAHLLRMTITSLIDQLPQDRFVRISRSLLVNLDRVKEIRPRSHGDYIVMLQDGVRLSGSRNYRRTLVELLEKPR